MNYTTVGTVPFSIKLKQDKKSSESCRSSFSNQSTTFSFSSKSVSSFSSAANYYSGQRSNNNNSSSKLHKSPRCFDDLNHLSKWTIYIIIVNYEKYIKTAKKHQSKDYIRSRHKAVLDGILGLVKFRKIKGSCVWGNGKYFLRKSHLE